MSATPRGTTSTRCSTELPDRVTPQTTKRRRFRRRFSSVPCPARMCAPLSGARSAADVDHRLVTGRRVLVDEAGNQYPTIERHHLPVLFAAGRSGWTDVVLAAGRSFQPQFLGGRLVGQMHHDTAGGAGPDDIGLLALRQCHLLRAWTVVGIVVSGKAPFAHEIVGTNRRRYLRLHGCFGLHGGRRRQAEARARSQK